MRCRYWQSMFVSFQEKDKTKIKGEGRLRIADMAGLEEARRGLGGGDLDI
jgi:hypothetical protein